MCPGAGSGGEITATRVPFYVGHAIMIIYTQLLYTGAPFLLRRSFLATSIVLVIVQIPELKLRL